MMMMVGFFFACGETDCGCADSWVRYERSKTGGAEEAWACEG